MAIFDFFPSPLHAECDKGSKRESFAARRCAKQFAFFLRTEGFFMLSSLARSLAWPLNFANVMIPICSHSFYALKHLDLRKAMGLAACYVSFKSMPVSVIPWVQSLEF